MEIPSMVCSQNGALIVRSLVSGDLLHPPTLSAARDDTKGDSQEPAAISVSTKINHENEDQSSSLVVSLKVPTNNNNNNNNEAFEDHHCEENGQSSKKDEKLPQCKIKRNYSCNNCSYFTQNPRRFLMHLRDTHGERITINDCKLCLYASRHYQKLVRHMRMVHGSTEGINEPSQSRRGQRGWKPGRKRSLEEDEELIDEPNFIPTNGLGDEHEYKSKLEKCTMCSFTTLSRDSLIAHEREDHAKTKFFRCHKCSYVTHIKARFSKHVKYHSMPMIKCMMCDFRTPYKWNLDRHMKNHGGAGPYKCSACSFSADIKQSLTVHETNHHIPPIEHNGGGTGDLPGHHRARGDWPEDLSMSSSQNSQEEDVPLDFTVAKTSDTELDSDSRPKKRPIPSLIPIQDSFNILKDMSKQNESSAYAAVGLLNEIYFKTLKNISLMFANSSSTPASDDVVTVEDDIPATVPKKAISMFEKLKEKMVSGVDDECQCGYKAKSLSDMLLHQNACQAHNSRTEPASSPSLYGSTRCQFCRHRCKTTDDLLLHLRVCEAKDEICKQESSDEAAIDNPDASDWGEEKPQPMNFFDQILCSNIEEISDDLGDLNGRKSGNFVSMKKVFKCPHCSFWASTASRFHVHIVGHLNKKPFECSLCSYRSNWRWDITKHIRLKTVRDINHKNAKVLMNDETGRRNYTKYNKYVTLMGVGESDIHSKQSKSEDSALSPTELVPPSNSSDTSGSSRDNNLDGALNFAAISNRQQRAILAQLHQQPQGTPQNTIVAAAVDESHSDVDSNSIKRTNFKCKKCDFKSYDRDEVMGHVKQHFLDVGISFMNPAPSSTPPLINIPLPPALQKPMDAPPSRMVTNLLDIMPNITIKPPPLAGHLVPNGNGSHSEPSMAGGSNSSVISSPSSLLMLNPSALNKAPSAAAATPSSNSLLKGTGATSTTILLSNIAAGSNNQTNNPMQGAGGSAITTNTSTATSSSNSTSAWRGPAPYRCGHCHQVSNWKHVIQVFY